MVCALRRPGSCYSVRSLNVSRLHAFGKRTHVEDVCAPEYAIRSSRRHAPGHEMRSFGRRMLFGKHSMVPRAPRRVSLVIFLGWVRPC